jgi:hypothetical protein
VIRSSVRVIAHRPDTIVGLDGTRIASVVLGRLAVVS